MTKPLERCYQCGSTLDSEQERDRGSCDGCEEEAEREESLQLAIDEDEDDEPLSPRDYE